MLVSGQPVDISGGHVFVESGVHVVVESGIPVNISGQHIHLESGDVINVYVLSGSEVTVQSGMHVNISGQHVHLESGDTINVYVLSGSEVMVQSGLHVMMSGQHIHLESGDTINVYVLSGSEVRTLPSSQMMIVDLSGNLAEVSQRHGGLVVMTDVTKEVHKGEMFHYSYMASGLGSMVNSDTLIFVASGKEMHANFGAMAGAAFRAFLYENPTCSDSGTPMLGCDGPNCMNRNISGTVKSLFSEGPTVTNVGCELFVGVGGTATGPAGKGGGAGTIRQDVEWMLNAASGMAEYLFRITNVDDAAKDVVKSVEFTEEDPIYWK